MQTFKTALVVTALLAALYVAHQALTKQQISLPLGLGAVGAGPTSDSALQAPDGVQIEAPPLTGWPSPSASASPTDETAGPNMPVALSGEAASLAVSPGLTPETPSGEASSTGAGAYPAHSHSIHDHHHSSSVSPAVALSPAESGDHPDLLDATKGPSRSSTAAGSAAAGGPTDSETAAATSGEAALAEPSPAVAKYAFEQAWHQAESEVAEGKLARALLTLSAFYRHPNLDDETTRKLNERLDQLAGTVIYSTRHLLEDPYRVQRGETLDQIAAQFNAPAKLLQNINGVRHPEYVAPGTELKVLRGPLRAEIDLAREELTLFLGGLYAGRFSIQAGDDPAPQPGQYEVLDIQPGRTYYSASGQTIPAGGAANPYGQWWLDLGRGACLHGRPDTGDGAIEGCLSLSPGDAADVASILSVGSKVMIRE